MATHNWQTTNVKYEKISEEIYYSEIGIYSSKIIASEFSDRSPEEWNGTINHKRASEVKALKYQYLFPEDKSLYKFCVKECYPTKGFLETEKSFQLRRSTSKASLTLFGFAFDNCDFLTSDDSLQKIKDFRADIIYFYAGDFNKNSRHVLPVIVAIRKYGYRGKIIAQVFTKRDDDAARQLYRAGADVVFRDSMFDNPRYAVLKAIED
ncbi:MAG: hypothetical protein CVV25_12435 [Ignavibacteriae bacterium HGW-Ignavibacteriae-4]|jgi:hypothetical protein|nr:MAG: hypothetical protein CVV25_12435 [Ignavibacteriae bacterium HGW-Ignavibacteriae-4]